MTPDTNLTETGNNYQVVMPKLGLTMTEATIVEWCKQDGEQVEKGETLFVIESEKSTLEIESPATGVLQILIPAGETVLVHQPIATLAHETRNTKHKARLTIPASPKSRALARRLGISLKGIKGTGPRNMIVASDVEKIAASRPKTRVSPVARKLASSAGLDLSTISGTGPGGRIVRVDVERTLSEPPPPEPVMPLRDAVEPAPLTGLRAVIAERLSASWRERPHVTLTTEADATNLISARQQAIAESGGKVSYDAFLVALAARALCEQPHVNVGVAVDTERGLLVPVVHNAATKSLLQIQRALDELVERALAGRSLPDDLSGGTFTITNLGLFEIDAFTPIINPPESAILGVGRIIAKPVAVDRQVVVRDMLALSLSFDHRLIDGAPAARFLQRIKQLVERPFALAI